MRITVNYPVLSKEVQALPFYITITSKENYVQKLIIRETGYTEYQISQCVSGKGKFLCGDKEYDIHPNDIFIFAPNVPHSYYNVGDEPWVLNFVCFLGQHVDCLFGEGHLVMKNICSPKIRDCFLHLEELTSIYLISNQLVSSCILYEMLIELIGYKKNIKNTNKRVESQLSTVVSYMENNLETDISIEELAKAINVSVSYLCRIFKMTYKMTPINYLTELRMTHAKKLLRTHTKLNINDVALRCGYNNLSYFCAKFKQNTNITPVSYRSQYL